MRLLLVRHGQSEWNATRRLQGQADIVLSDMGREPARRLAPLIAAIGPDRAITSDLVRAAETADLLGRGHAQPSPARSGRGRLDRGRDCQPVRGSACQLSRVARGHLRPAGRRVVGRFLHPRSRRDRSRGCQSLRQPAGRLPRRGHPRTGQTPSGPAPPTSSSPSALPPRPLSA